MKLSLTAIAALFAATLHSSVATGTRAASANGNTNAAEDKPHRDLGIMEDMGFEFGIGDKKTEIIVLDALSDMMQVHDLVQCFLSKFGQQVDSVHGWWLSEQSPQYWLFEALPDEAHATLKDLAGSDLMITESKLYGFLMGMPDFKLSLFAGFLGKTCAFGAIIPV